MKVNQLDIPGIGSNGKYVDDNKTPGQERAGTSFLALFPNQLIEELQENFIKKAGLIPSDTDTGQIKKSFDIFLNRLNVELSGKINGLQDQVYSSLRGNIMAFAGSIDKIPTNTLFCDGREISRTTYAKVFEKIGTAWGVGNGTTTFNIPDGRSGVLKGSGLSDKYDRNYDRGAVGSYENTGIINITGNVTYLSQTTNSSSGSFVDISYAGPLYAGGENGKRTSVMLDTSRVVPVAETDRDNGFVVNFIIFI